MDKVSVLIPLYNKENYIEDTLLSIDKQITRDQFLIEVVVVDDCSTDKSVEVIRKYQWSNKSIEVKYLANETNSGPAVSFNKALDNSSGDFIVPQDADDLMLRLGLYKRWNAFQSDSTIDWVSGHLVKITQEGFFVVASEAVSLRGERITSGQELVSDLLKSNINMSSQSLMVKRNPIMNTRWIDLMRSSQDTALHLCLAINGYKLKKIDDYVAVYRSSSKNVGQSLLSQSILSGQKVKDLIVLKEVIGKKLNAEQLSYLDERINSVRNHKLLQLAQ